jgi:hypothetical protein
MAQAQVAKKLYQQPTFVENIIIALQGALKDKEDALVVVRPDYAKPVGAADNLFRTTLHLQQQEVPKDIALVHISNIPYDGGKTTVVVFGDLQNDQSRRTLNYQDATTMMSKEHLVSNLGCRNIKDIDSDILTYLVEGKLPQ